VEVPTVIGWLRPVILLPAGCLLGLSAAQLEAILAHELAHIRRHDYLVNLLQNVVETLLFYHPAVWWVSRRIREERENCCDDLAVEICGDRVTYARALATLEELRHAPGQLALAAAGAPLLQRIRRLAGKSGARASRPGWPLAGIVALLIVFAVAMGLRGNRVLAAGEPNAATNAAPSQTLTNQGMTAKTPDQNHAYEQNPPSVRQLVLARTNVVHDGPGASSIHTKLNQIMVDSVKYDNLPLGEVINNLAEIAKERDPEHVGINFFIDRVNSMAAARASAAIATAGDNDVAAVKIFVPTLNNLRLTDVLDAIVRGADQPIRYSVLEYAVRFYLRDAEAAPLELRTFHVDPNTFRQGLEGVAGTPFGNVTTGGNGSGGAGGGGSGRNNGGGQTGVIKPGVNVTDGVSDATFNVEASGSPPLSYQWNFNGANLSAATGLPSPSANQTSSNANDWDTNTQSMIRKYMKSVGVDMGLNNPANAGNAFSYNARKGILTMRATSNELAKVEAPIQIINLPKGVNLKVKFVEIDEAQTHKSGLDWFFSHDVAGVVTKELPEVAPFIFRGQGISNSLPSATNSILLQMCGTLTEKQFEERISELERINGVDVLNLPEVTTESGRQAQVQMVSATTVVTGVDSSRDTNGAVTYNYTTSNMFFGPAINLVPKISDDYTQVSLKVIPVIIEFLGYEDPRASGKPLKYQDAPVKATEPLPQYRLRELAADVSVADGDTIVLGGVAAESVNVVKDRVPYLSAIPWLGKYFCSTSTTKTRKNILVFVTPTIIEPDGRRFRKDQDKSSEEKAK
jgi:type II secretory pathway component GspD/PulD (secretin)